MSLDASLKSRTALSRHRNVLTRAQRIEKLEDEARWREGDDVFGLPKVKHRKSAAGGTHTAERKAEAAAAAAAAEAAAEQEAADQQADQDKAKTKTKAKAREK